MFITALLMSQLTHQTFRVIQPAKPDRVRRTGLGAGGGEFPIGYLATFRLGFIFCLMDALNTECALLHDTAAADSHIRVELIMQRVDKLTIHIVGMEWNQCIVAPIELADLVRAVVCAITRAYAAVVDLQIELL